MSERETWATRAGFILAAVGSAVGLGNIWQFPFKTAQFGGASFLVVYLIAVFGIGLPAILAEFVIGRRAKLNAISAFGRIGHRQWRFVGALGLLTGFWILSYYSVVGGWVIRYIWGSLQGAYFGDPATYFGAVSAGLDAVALHAVFMFLCVVIVALGIEDGIEKATKVMVPSIVVILLGLAVYGTTLSGATAGYDYFLSPDFGALMSNLGDIVPFAVGQAFFSLSLGMGAMITYASYIDRDDSLVADGSTIVVLNTFVGVLAGFVVFPLLFAQGIDPNTSGPGAVFVSVAGAFANIPAGRIVGLVFFLVVLIAALSSAISLLEVVTSYVIDNYDVGRAPTAAAIGVSLFVLGLPSALDTAWLGWFDTLAYQLLLPVSVLLVLLFVGWVLGDEALSEVLKGAGVGNGFGVTWLWMVRIVVILAVLGTLALGIQTLFLGSEPAIVPPL
ncbi:sodium-dependent transporter [Halopelagius longus]|uniref:Neurotransmitter:Na+ symporter, NSS family n=1 Tax=Halopelagius longus TaxID=1236180 RepID=A0A1H0YVU8_9EURY|nr:sodium-dependent transporter [Halopelagius longus]RDI72691.1 sodium-dependent transporter [Halopelagius longus]SDQ18976.1 neurotransmitter:Na+ symporter, NSS family [Halopelagius longus]